MIYLRNNLLLCDDFCILETNLITTNKNEWKCKIYIGCSFKFLLKVGVEESIVNAPLVSVQSKPTNNAKSEVRFKQLIRNP
jgi:hypothetical protein